MTDDLPLFIYQSLRMVLISKLNFTERLSTKFKKTIETIGPLRKIQTLSDDIAQAVISILFFYYMVL